MKKIKFLLLYYFFMIQPVFAYDSITSNVKYALKHSVHSNYVSVIIALGVVILLIYITGVIYAKLNVFGQSTMKKQYMGLNDSKVLILSSTPIGNNKSLLVVELAGKKMLIGVTNENISLIKDLSENSNPNLPLNEVKASVNDLDNGDIEIKSNAPSEDENDSPYVTEEFGLYKKYLAD